MPGELHIGLRVDLGELSRDLRAMGKDLDKPLREAIARGVEMIAATAKPLMRFRAEGAWTRSSGAQYTHIREYYDARVNILSGSVGSDHPAAPVWEWGGTIHPLLGEFHHVLTKSSHKQQLRLQLAVQGFDRPPWTFDIPAEHPVGRAADKSMPEVERVLDTAVSRLLRQYGF